ncbi:MAG: T9SS C-terminal target domain-containing protein [Methanobacteriota archaeon]|nr:MAG: T9SS C-terminal target domain-containing protein [Euryarchaeota archaeon]
MTKRTHVTLKVFDLLGREITTLVDEMLTPGEYKATFEGKNLPSGVYIYRLQAGDNYQQRKMILLK